MIYLWMSAGFLASFLVGFSIACMIYAKYWPMYEHLKSEYAKVTDHMDIVDTYLESLMALDKLPERTGCIVCGDPKGIQCCEFGADR